MSHQAKDPFLEDLQRQTLNDSRPFLVKEVTFVSPPSKKSGIYLLCANKGRKFAIPIEQVDAIVQPSKMTKVPTVRQDVLGLVNLKGTMVPVFDLVNIFGLPDKRRYLISCKVNDDQFAFEIDEAEQVIELPESTMQEIEIVSAKKNHQYIHHVSIVNEQTIFIIDLKEVVAS